MKIFIFYSNEPVLDISHEQRSDGTTYHLGLHRDRLPDADWSELRRTIITNAKEVEMTEELKTILLEDLAFTYGDDTKKFNAKLKEFNFIT